MSPGKLSKAPGNFDPVVNDKLQESLQAVTRSSPGVLHQRIATVINALQATRQYMQIGSSVPWWDNTHFAEVDLTNVQNTCTPEMGRPNVEDCERASFSFIRAGIVRVTRSPKYFRSGMPPHSTLFLVVWLR